MPSCTSEAIWERLQQREAGKDRIGHTEPCILLTHDCSSKVRRQRE